MRDNRATVRDEGLGAAFRQGFQEGLSMLGSEVVFKITVATDGVAISTFSSTSPEAIMNRVKHYLTAQNVGVVLTVSVETVSGTKEIEANDDDIIDAEVIESPS